MNCPFEVGDSVSRDSWHGDWYEITRVEGDIFFVRWFDDELRMLREVQYYMDPHFLHRPNSGPW